MLKKNLLVTALCFWTPIMVSAAVIHVPGDQPTIQQGLDAAADGDTVMVADGTYTGALNKNLDFNGKAVILTSEGETEDCLIDCENSGRGFIFGSGEGNDSVVQGFTIQNGNIDYGGGIICSSSSPTIKNNIIRNNSGSQSGGAIYCMSGAQPLIQNNLIVDNVAGRKGGGGMQCYYSNPIIEGNTLIGNSTGIVPEDSVWGEDEAGGSPGAAGFGLNAGRFARQDDPDIDASHPPHDLAEHQMSEREAIFGGGAISLFFCFPIMTGNTIINNHAYFGGGIFCFQASPRIEETVLTGNWANFGGAVYYSGGASPKIYESEITGNRANRYGGGMYGWYSGGAGEVVGCLLSGNRAGEFGGAISCRHLSVLPPPVRRDFDFQQYHHRERGGEIRGGRHPSL